MKEGYKLLALCFLAGAISGAVASIAINHFTPKSSEQMIAEFYATETAVGVSPADYAADLNSGILDGTAVDLRSAAEYNAGHLVTAVNIPAVSMDRAQVLAAFAALPKDKPIITYCYSGYCMLSRQVGNVLAENGMYVKHFTAGWYEINRDYPEYVVNGTQPGSWKNATYVTGVCTTGEFRC
ncbi:Rhodanese-like domain protein [uncultured archaeon]|nr:Rhodanese-like domain protein [uncultured archaeon]